MLIGPLARKHAMFWVLRTQRALFQTFVIMWWPWLITWSGARLEKVIFAWIFKNFHTFYGIQKFTFWQHHVFTSHGYITCSQHQVSTTSHVHIRCPHHMFTTSSVHNITCSRHVFTSWHVKQHLAFTTSHVHNITCSQHLVPVLNEMYPADFHPTCF